MAASGPREGTAGSNCSPTSSRAATTAPTWPSCGWSPPPCWPTCPQAGGRDPGSVGARRSREILAEQVTTLFLQHAELAVTVRDFYAYLGHVLTRNHLAPDEIAGFRDLLVDYIQLVVEDVLRHTPTIAGTLATLVRRRTEMLDLLGSGDPL